VWVGGGSARAFGSGKDWCGWVEIVPQGSKLGRDSTDWGAATGGEGGSGEFGLLTGLLSDDISLFKKGKGW
jgi:hypothetical protein